MKALCVQGITNSEFAEMLLHQNLGIATDRATYRYSDIQAQTTFVSRTFPSTAGILTTANLQTGKTAYLTQFESIKPKENLEDLDFEYSNLTWQNSYHSIDVLTCACQTRCGHNRCFTANFPRISPDRRSVSIFPSLNFFVTRNTYFAQLINIAYIWIDLHDYMLSAARVSCPYGMNIKSPQIITIIEARNAKWAGQIL